MTKTRLRIALLVFISLALSCETIEKPQNPSLDEKDFDFVVADPSEAGAKLPVTMWSPQQRQASAGFYYLIGEYSALLGDTPASQQYLTSAYQLDPKQFLAEKLLQIQLRNRMSLGSLDQVKTFSLLYPKSKTILQILANQAMLEKDYKKALQANQRALDIAPDDESIAIQRVQIYQLSDSHSKTKPSITALLQKFPRSLTGWTILSQLEAANKNFSAAFVAAKKALELAPRKSEILLFSAWIADKAGRVDEARGLYLKFFEKQIDHEATLARHRSLKKIFGSAAAALKSLDDLAKIPVFKPLSKLHVLRVYLNWDLRHDEEAQRIIEEFNSSSKVDPQFIFLSGVNYERQKKFPLAIKSYMNVPEGSDYFVVTRYKLGVLLREQGQLEKANEIISSMLTSQFSSWEFYVLAGQVLDDMGQTKESIRVLGKGHQKHPNKTQLLFLRGVYEEKEGLREQCIETMQAVIAADPSFSNAYNYLGYLYADAGENLVEAEALVLKALTLKPDDGFYLDSLGWIYYKLGKMELAITTLEKAVAIQPNEALIIEHLADAYRHFGETKKALTLYIKAISLSEEPDEKKRIREKIDEIS